MCDHTLMSTLNDIHAFTVSIIRLGAGMRIRSTPAEPPTQPLELYAFEACPFCRKVREALSELDLDYIHRPCAKGADRNRAALRERGGREQFPYLVDPNTGTELYESEDIITYLEETYAGGQARWRRAIAPLRTLGAALGSAVRRRGMRVRDGIADRPQTAEMLELWEFEASPYCRKVREALCELDLDVVIHTVAKGGARRPRLIERGGKMQVPYLADPNTGTELYESDDIVAYLEETYGPA